MTFLPGDEPTAQELEDLRVLTVIKAADESRNTTAVLANDSELVLAVAASSTYAFESTIFFNTTSTPNYKGQWTLPASGAMTFQCTGYSIAGTLGIFSNTLASVQTMQGFSSSRPHFMTGTITTSVTAGNLRWQWAQNTSNATATITLAGSYIKIWKAT